MSLLEMRGFRDGPLFSTPEGITADWTNIVSSIELPWRDTNPADYESHNKDDGPGKSAFLDSTPVNHHTET